MTLPKQENHPESNPKLLEPPLFVRQLSPEMHALLEQHFWCDFSDIIPSMAWDQNTHPTQ